MINVKYAAGIAALCFCFSVNDIWTVVFVLLARQR